MVVIKLVLCCGCSSDVYWETDSYSSKVLAISWSAFRCANIPSVKILICTWSLLMEFFQDQMFWAAILIYFIPVYSYCIWAQTRHIQSGFRVRMTCFLCWFLHVSRMQHIWTCKNTCDIQPGQSAILFAGIYPLSSPTVHKHEKTLAVNIIDCVFSLCNKTCLYFHSSAHNHGNRRADRERGWSDVSEGTTGEREVLPFD